MLLLVMGGVSSAWAVDVPTPVYFNDFSSTDGLTIVGSGEFITDDDAHFGQIYHNDPNLTKAVRTNYLLLPSDVLSHSATTKEITIGFWVNKKGAADFFFSPIFAAYAAAPTDGNNSWPMFVCEARGLIQLNCAGYCDFGINDASAGTTYNDGTPYVSSTWLDDAAWHYYTVALTSTTAKVYVDGVLKNGWTVDGTSDGQVISGLFTNGSELKYICLGGNQAWGWGDLDPAFGFDDFAVYDAALSAEQIAQIMTDKMADDEEEEVSNDITNMNVIYDYTTDAALSGNVIRPFDAGTVKAGTNVKALTVNNTTATAWFDSDTETDGRQPYSIAANEKVNIFINAYHGWLSSGKDITVTLYAPEEQSLASYVYNVGSCKITDVKIGGKTVDGFTSFGMQSANGLVGNGKPYAATGNPEISISISGSGYVEMSFSKGGTSIGSYSATLDKSIYTSLEKITINNPNNNDDRAYHIGKLTISTEETTEAMVTYQFEDTNGNSLAEVKSPLSAPGTIGDAIENVIPASYKNTFYNGDNTMKYVYSTFACTDGTIPAEGTTVTLKFTPYAKYTHNVMAVDEESNEIGEVATGTAFADESMTLYWSKYVKFDDQWYVTTTYGGTYTEAGTTNITFQTADIIDFIECENTNYKSAGDQTGATNASGGVGVLLQSKNAMTLKNKLAAGKYDISLYAYVRRANDDKLKLQYSADGSAWTDVETLTFESSKAQTQTAYVELAEDSYIQFVDSVGQNSCHYYDYIVIAPHYNNYTVKIEGTEIAIASGNCKEGETYTVTLNEVFADGGKFYVLSDESVVDYQKTYTMGSGDEVKTITYTEDPTIVFYSENNGYMSAIEGVGYSGGFYMGNPSGNYGNARNRGIGVGTLQAGTYELTANIVGTHSRNICARTTEGTYNTGNAPMISLTGKGIKTGTFVLGGEKTIVLTGANSGEASGSNSGAMPDFDYVIIRKTGDAALDRVKVTDAGYATFYSDYALDFSGTGLTAYIAKNGVEKDIEFEAVTTVPANTGVLLKGEAKTYDIPVITSDDEASSLLVGSTIYKKIEDAGIFVLMNGDKGVGFYKTKNAFTVGAHTAYLPAAVAEGRAFIGFDFDETTAIKGINVKEDSENTVYSLSGQRVNAPKRGLYIVNGKKVVMK